jgi:opacity protein-like surface antigen
VIGSVCLRASDQNHAADPESIESIAYQHFPLRRRCNSGWTLGAGLEAALAPNWTAKVEYLYVDLGSFNCGLNCGAGLVNDNVSFRTNILRAGVNYKF